MVRGDLIAATIPDAYDFRDSRSDFRVSQWVETGSRPANLQFYPQDTPKSDRRTSKQSFLQSTRPDEIAPQSRGPVQGTHEVRLVPIHADHALRQPQREGVDMQTVSRVGRRLPP